MKRNLFAVVIGAFSGGICSMGALCQLWSGQQAWALAGCAFVALNLGCVWVNARFVLEASK